MEAVTLCRSQELCEGGSCIAHALRAYQVTLPLHLRYNNTVRLRAYQVTLLLHFRYETVTLRAYQVRVRFGN